MEDHGYLVRFVCVDPSRCHLISGAKIVTTVLGQNPQGEFTMFCFQTNEGGQRAHSVSAFLPCRQPSMVRVPGWRVLMWRTLNPCRSEVLVLLL